MYKVIGLADMIENPEKRDCRNETAREGIERQQGQPRFFAIHGTGARAI